MSNPFELGSRKIIPAVLIYVKQGTRVLMLHRITQGGDYHAGKWNGLGGKLELNESPLEAAVRELREESSLELAPGVFQNLGVIQFPNFKSHKNEDWWVTVFSARLHKDVKVPLAACDEGELHWIEQKELLNLNLWAGDRHFVPFVLEETPFFGTIWYEGEKVLKHEIHLL